MSHLFCLPFRIHFGFPTEQTNNLSSSNKMIVTKKSLIISTCKDGFSWTGNKSFFVCLFCFLEFLDSVDDDEKLCIWNILRFDV